MKKEELEVILRSHEMWLNDEGGQRADLYDTDLLGADLRGFNLCDADICSADLRGADLRGANLCGANLSGANISSVNVNEETTFFSLQCPEEGSFIAYKNVKNYIIKLEIPAESRRSSATTRKCRCEYAKVLSITNLDGSDANVDTIVNTKYTITKYIVGEMVYPDRWDDNRWNECSHGIHFFITREEAVNY